MPPIFRPIENDKNDSDNVILQQFVNEHKKSLFFESFQKGIAFEYTYEPSVLKITPKGSQILGFPQTMVEPEKSNKFWDIIGRDNWDEFSRMLHDSQLNNDSFIFNGNITVKGKKRSCKIKVQQTWNRLSQDTPQLISVYGCIELL